MRAQDSWLPAACGMACLGLGAGLIGIFGFFVGPLSQEFGVGAAVINIGPVALLLVPGIVAPHVGRLADRLPVRRMVLFGTTLAMASLLAITQVSALWQAGVLFLCFSLGLTFYGPVVVNGLMVKLYPGREARALAIAAIGISIASATLPPLMGALLSFLDWRTTLALLAAGVLCLLWVMALTTLPPGVVGSAADGEHPPAADFYRRREFWLIGLCVAMALGVAVLLAVVYPPHFLARGFTLAQAGWFLSFAGMAGLLGKACVAWLGDAGRARAKWLAMALLLLQIAGLGLLLRADSVASVLPAMSLLGFGSGAFIPMHPYLNSRYFDARVISHVIGAQMPLFLPFGLFGAPLAGYVFDRTGSYDLVLMVLAAILAVAMLLALRLPPAAPGRA
ncbi:MAG: MFS transporter [Halioglobus sp.]|nr:MFS transporter [Halioglobus sp.]